MTHNERRSRLRLIRRRDRVRKGLPLRAATAREPRLPDDAEEERRPPEDLDTPDLDMIGIASMDEA